MVAGFAAVEARPDAEEPVAACVADAGPEEGAEAAEDAAEEAAGLDAAVAPDVIVGFTAVCGTVF